MYNIRIIEHFNGSIQIQQYNDVVGIPINSSATKGWREKENDDDNRRKSLSHTRNMINIYARSAFWEWFVTFTFSPEFVDRTNFKECMAKVRNWLNNARKRLSNDLKYLVVPELHADKKSWHIHMLLADAGAIKFIDSGHKVSGEIIYNLDGWKWGFSTATRVKDIYKIQGYISKYITKDCHQLAKGAHRYYTSHNLPLPIKTMFYVPKQEQDIFIKQVTESFGKDIVYISHTKNPDTYIQVTYYELN